MQNSGLKALVHSRQVIQVHLHYAWIQELHKAPTLSGEMKHFISLWRGQCRWHVKGQNSPGGMECRLRKIHQTLCVKECMKEGDLFKRSKSILGKLFFGVFFFHLWNTYKASIQNHCAVSFIQNCKSRKCFFLSARLFLSMLSLSSHALTSAAKEYWTFIPQTIQYIICLK